MFYYIYITIDRNTYSVGLKHCFVNTDVIDKECPVVITCSADYAFRRIEGKYKD